MSNEPTTKVFDLCERAFVFARQVRLFVKKLPRTISNIEDVRQLIKSSGAVGANYVEANEALGRKDFTMRARIARKEAKESAYWLRLIDTGTDPIVDVERNRLVGEATELLKILSAIIRKCEPPR